MQLQAVPVVSGPTRGTLGGGHPPVLPMPLACCGSMLSLLSPALCPGCHFQGSQTSPGGVEQEWEEDSASRTEFGPRKKRVEKKREFCIVTAQGRSSGVQVKKKKGNFFRTALGSQTSLVVQWLRIALQLRGVSVPGWGTKIPHAVGPLRPCTTIREPGCCN